MDANEKLLNTFATRARQMMLRFEELKQENQQLRATVSERDARISDLTKQMESVRADYKALREAKMMTIADGDIEESKRKIAKLIRGVDKCITLLSEK